MGKLVLETGMVTNIYRNPWRRRQLEGQAELIKCIYEGENGDLWEVKFTDIETNEKRPWRHIWKAPTVSDDYVKQQKSRAKKKTK
jgi:hypothetical protein